MAPKRQRHVITASAKKSGKASFIPEEPIAVDSKAPAAVTPDVSPPSPISPEPVKQKDSALDAIPANDSVSSENNSASSQPAVARAVVTKVLPKQKPKLSFLFEEETSAPKKERKLSFLFDGEGSKAENSAASKDLSSNIETDKSIETKTITADVDGKSVLHGENVDQTAAVRDEQKKNNEPSNRPTISKGIKRKRTNIDKEAVASNEMEVDSVPTAPAVPHETTAKKDGKQLRFFEKVETIADTERPTKLENQTKHQIRTAVISKSFKHIKHNANKVDNSIENIEAALPNEGDNKKNMSEAKPEEHFVDTSSSAAQQVEAVPALRSNDMNKEQPLKPSHSATRITKLLKRQKKKYIASAKASKVSKEVTQDVGLLQLKSEEEKDATRKAEEELAQKRSQEEAAHKRAEEEAAQKKAEEEAARKRAEEEAAQKKAEEEAARKRAEEEAARKKAEEEAAQKRAEEEAAQRKTEEEAARKRAEEEAAQKKAEEKAARKKAEEEAARKRAEEEAAQKKAEEEAARKRAEEEAARKKAEEEAAQKRAEEEAAQKKIEEEAARKRAEEAARRKERRVELKRAKEEAAQKKAEIKAARRKARLEASKKSVEEKAAKNRAEEEAAQKKAEEEAAQKRTEEEAAQKKIEEEAARKRAEEKAAQKKAEEKAAQKKAEEEAAQKKAEEEAAQKKAEEEAARKKADEEAAQKKAKEEVLSEKERRRSAKKKVDRYRKQVEARQRYLQGDSATQGVVEKPLVELSAHGNEEVAPTSAEELLTSALTFPNDHLTIEKFDEDQLVARRRSVEEPWEIGLRFDWTVKTLAIGSLPLFRSTDPRRLHPFMKTFESRPVWFLEEVNGTKANNIREVMEVLKKSVRAHFVFRK